MQAALAQLHHLLPDLDLTVIKMMVSGDMAAIHLVFTGTHMGDLLEMPATHRPIRFIAFDMHRVSGDLIVESWHLEDNFALLTQIGMIPNLA